MLELLLCSMFTILPDYLYRRYGQGKRIGKEITLFSVWFELRWGIVGCLMLTIGLITVVFYNHPSTTNVTSFFRTIPILPESIGRVSEIYVGVSDTIEEGQADLPARQLQAGGRARGGAPQDHRGRRVDGGGPRRHRGGRGADPAGPERAPAGRRRAGDQGGAEPARRRHRGAARDRAPAERRRGPQGRCRRGGRGQAGHGGQAREPAAG